MINVFKLEEYLAKYEFSAKYLLCCSDAETFTMSEILSIANTKEKEMWEHLKLGYTEVKGSPLLRQTIAHKLYPSLKSDDIMMFAGAEEGIFCSLYALIEKEDHVIVLTPCYQSLLEIPKIKEASITQIELQEKNYWQIDIEEIKSHIKYNTKCIIINFPHNPTGSVINQSSLNSLIEICKQKQIWIFSDEVYRLLGKPKNSWSLPAACNYDKAISLGVMSKAFGMAGLRIGWIACQNQEFLQKVEQTKHYTSICNSAPAEILSLITLNNLNKILDRNNKIVEENLNLLDQFFIEYSNLFEWIRPEGGCVGFVKYKGKNSVEDFCKDLLKSKNTLLMPDHVFKYNENYFRIGFGRKNMSECLQKLKDFLDSQNI